MAHFYGKLMGGRKEIHRTGTPKSGMSATVASWEGAVSIDAWHDKKTGKDMVSVAKRPWQGVGETKLLYAGKIGQVI